MAHAAQCDARNYLVSLQASSAASRKEKSLGLGTSAGRARAALLRQGARPPIREGAGASRCHSFKGVTPLIRRGDEASLLAVRARRPGAVETFKPQTKRRRRR